MIKLVLTDVDGTLVPMGAGRLSDRSRAAAHALADVGVRFGLSTGRDVFELERMFEGDAELYGNGILSNGKKIMVDGACARLTLLEREGLMRLDGLIRTFPESCLCIYPLESDITNPVYCVGTTEEEIAQASERFSFRPIIVDEVPDVDIIGATISVLADQDVTDAIKRAGAVACPMFDFVQPASHWTDVVPHGLNKGTALSAVLEVTGLEPDEVVVFGDSENDLALLCAATHSVAVANATPAVTAAARYHIGASEDEAVAKAMEEIVAATLEGRMPAFFTE